MAPQRTPLRVSDSLRRLPEPLWPSRDQVSADGGVRNGGLRKRLFSMQTEFQKSMQHLFLFCENQCNTCAFFWNMFKNVEKTTFPKRKINATLHVATQKSMQHYMWQHKNQCNTCCSNPKINAKIRISLDPRFLNPRLHAYGYVCLVLKGIRVESLRSVRLVIHPGIVFPKHA